MRSVFPAYFRPSANELEALWRECHFAFDANVLLNLYRYSPTTRQALEHALTSVGARVFLPHQAAREFLRNRLGVIAGQSKEYTGAIDTLNSLVHKLSDRKRHPFINDESLESLTTTASSLAAELEEKRNELLNRLIHDERLAFVESIFEGKTGQPFTSDELDGIAVEGDARFEKRIPPGYMDAGKNTSDDSLRKYGDLIIWKQLIAFAKESEKAVVLVSDDSKEDWWLEQSGRTIGPRVELREEFLRETSRDFWMYTVDAFLEQSAKARNETVSEAVIAEIVEVSTDAKESWGRAVVSQRPAYRPITEEEMVSRLRSSERWARDHEGFIGLHSFVQNYLGGADFDFDSCYKTIEALEEKGVVELYEHQGAGHPRPVRAVRIRRRNPGASRPFEGLKDLLGEPSGD